MHLHHTFCPDTARDISLSRLAITLGFRSACYDWVLMMTADACPPSHHWLTGMAYHMTEEVDAVQGFVCYGHPHGWTGIKQHFFRLWQQSLWIPWCTHFAPYRADESCLAYRKSLFMSHQGFASNFSLRYGAGPAWTDGEFEFKITVHLGTKSPIGNIFETYFRLSPDKLFRPVYEGVKKGASVKHGTIVEVTFVSSDDSILGRY